MRKYCTLWYMILANIVSSQEYQKITQIVCVMVQALKASVACYVLYFIFSHISITWFYVSHHPKYLFTFSFPYIPPSSKIQFSLGGVFNHHLV